MLRSDNQLIRFLANGILFITLVFIMDLMLGSALRHFYFMQKGGFNYHLKYSMDSTDAAVIILGSSRACRHYVPEIFEDSLALTCFNTGIDGNYVFNSFAVYKSIVKRYKPEIVIMDLNQGDIYKEIESYDRLSSLLPYYRNNKEIRSIILLKSKLERLKLVSNVYPFNSSILAICDGVLKTEDITENMGYMPTFGSLSDTTLSPQQKILNEIDTNKIKVLDAIAFDCKMKHIQLIFLQSPRYCKVEQGSGVSIINELAVKHDVELWDYVNDTIFLKPEYFKDDSHMNDLGAREFTRAIAHRVRRDIRKNTSRP